MAREREVKVKILGDASSAQRAFGSMTHSSSKFGTVMKSVGKGVLLGGGLIAGGLALGAKAAFDAAIEAEKVSAQTSAALKSTGRVANVTKDDIEGLAQGIMGYSGISDEAVQASENLLLTFKNVRNETGKGNDIFNQTTKAIADMSVALGKDLNSSTIMVGKAMNDPIKGIAAMGRAGVQFTDQQKEQITTLVESGKTMDAQKIILKELEAQFGGSAKAIGKTTEGQFNIAKESVGNFLETVGQKLAPIIADAAQKIADFVSSEEFQEWFDRAIKFVGDLVSAIREFAGPIVKGLIDAVGWVVDALKGAFGSGGDGREAVGGFVEAVRNFIAPLIKWWKRIWPDVKEAVKNVFNGIKSFWKTWGDNIMGVLKAVWDAVKGIVKAAIKVVQGVIETVLAIIRGDWGDAWGGIKKILSGVWDAIKSIVSNGIKAAKEVLIGVLKAIREAFRAIWGGIKEIVKDAVGAIADFIDDITPSLNDLLNLATKVVNAIPGGIGNVGVAPRGSGGGNGGGGNGGSPSPSPRPTPGPTSARMRSGPETVSIPLGVRMKVDLDNGEAWFDRQFGRTVSRAGA